MYLNPLNWALVLCSLAGLIDNVHPSASANYPGVIELVGFSDRRARTHYMAPDELQRQSKSKMASDIETVKQNIEKYNKLLKMDTKNLPDSQKEILERIVERVARLKESIDINQQQAQADNITTNSSNESAAAPNTDAADENSQETTLSDDSLATSSESAAAYSSSSSSIEDTTKNQDATTTSDASLMMSTAVEDIDDYSMATNQDINASDEIAAAKEIDAIAVDNDESNIHADDDDRISSELNEDNADDGEIPTSTTIGSGETDEDQFVAARSNNNNHRTLVSTSKTKSRPNSTKRPGSSSSSSSSSSSTLTKLSTSSIKRVNGQKPSSMVGSSMKPTTTSFATSTSTITTVQPMVKIQKPSLPIQQTKEPLETMMKVQHQSPQKQQQQQQLNKVQQTYQQQEQEAAAAAAATAAAAAAAASSLAALQQQQQIQIEQKTMSTPPILQQQQQQAAAVQIQQRTPIGGTIGSSSGSSITNTAGSSLSSDMLYDSNVNTSSIIDSLNNAREEFYNKAGINNKDKKTSATAKPTKYHYYPHNQHIYLLPECAIQQVCNAVYVRLNYTQPLCACPSRYRDPCSASLNEDDQHTTKLVGDGKKKAITLAKTCETITEMRECRSPKDWSLLALQNTRTGKSHYLVICRCPDHFKMEGPMAHDQPTYASVPGIRVFGMMCVKPGFSVRKPSVQPPKRYQLQKPYYIPNSQNKYSSIKDHNRPSYGSSSLGGGGGSSSLNYQPPPQHHTLHQQDTYQYLNRPESSSTLFVSSSNNHGHNSHNDYPESISFNGGIYGRNNERNGEKPIPAAEEDITSTSSSSSSDSDSPPSSSSISPISSDETKSEEISRTSSAEIDESPTTLDSAATDAGIVSKRDKRSIVDFESEIFDDESTPEFPWQRAIAFQRSIVWD